MPAPSNRTLVLDPIEEKHLLQECLIPSELDSPVPASQLDRGGRLDDRLILGDALAVLPMLPSESVDLIIVDPPYNLSKDFHGFSFQVRDFNAYLDYVRSWMGELARILKPGGSLYACTEWRSSATVQLVASENLVVRNRITWEREKGRGAKANWKNASEDIWFCTKGDGYYFNVDAVKMRRSVRAPYRDGAGRAKDWSEASEENGRWRDTHPSNLWTDLSVPFWSMPENTAHPTQKPEKLAAKLILASSREGDLVFDPFAGSGTSLVAARKLGRRCLGIEQNSLYAALSLKRLEMAKNDTRIQGYEDGVFWERNSLGQRQKR